MLTEKTLVTSRVNALQVELKNHGKDEFYEQLLTCISSTEDSKIHIIAKDVNGHVGKESVTFDNYHQGKG